MKPRFDFEMGVTASDVKEEPEFTEFKVFQEKVLGYIKYDFRKYMKEWYVDQYTPLGRSLGVCAKCAVTRLEVTQFIIAETIKLKQIELDEIE